MMIVSLLSCLMGAGSCGYAADMVHLCDGAPNDQNSAFKQL